MITFLTFLAGSLIGWGIKDLNQRWEQRKVELPVLWTKSTPHPYRESAKPASYGSIVREQAESVADKAFTDISPLAAGPKIIRKAATKFERTCDNCNAVFEYGMADVQGITTWVKCPSCHSHQWHFATNAVRETR